MSGSARLLVHFSFVVLCAGHAWLCEATCADRLFGCGRRIMPRYAKMLVLGHQGGCLPYAVAMVAALSVENPILYDKSDGVAAVGGEEDKELEELEELKEKGIEKERSKVITRRDREFHVFFRSAFS